MAKREWKVPIENVNVDSYYAIVERLETIVEQLDTLLARLPLGR